MAECVATVGAGVSQELLDAICEKAGSDLTPGQWLKAHLIELTGVKLPKPVRAKKSNMSNMLATRVPRDVRKKMAEQAKLEGMPSSKWLRRAVERALSALPGTGLFELREARIEEPVGNYPLAYFRGTPDLRWRVDVRAKEEGMSKSTWLRYVVEGELGLLGQLMLEFSEEDLEWMSQDQEALEEDMPEEVWSELAEAEGKQE